VIYLVFNEGYLPSGEPRGLADEAVRLTRMLRRLLPEPEVTGLLALELLTEARRASRTDETGELVTLDEQDRGGWDRALIAEGHALVRECLTINRPGPYQVQAAINAVHCDAADFRDTDWSQLAALYDQLYAMTPSPVVALNRAVVTAELDGPEVALAAVDRLPLEGYHAFHATRAELLRRLGRSAEAREAYTRAIELAANDGEVRHLTRRRGELVSS
jgi:RNA polymerase sigma-70 factor (ECF subfamily)